MWEQIAIWDRELFQFLNGLWIDDFNGFWLFVTEPEHWIPLYLLLFFLVYRYLKKPLNFISVIGIPVVTITTLYLTNVVKNYVERLRPNNEPVLMDSIKILQTPENFSFWSGHSAVSFAVTTFVVLLLRHRLQKKGLLLLYIWPFTFAFSRIFVGVHYPADVAVGMLVGLFLGWLFYRLALATGSKLSAAS